MAMNFDGIATHAPRRGRPFTSGSFLGSSLPSSFSFAGASVSVPMSLTLRDRSRSLPSASMRPGFSLPAGPKRTSFMLFSSNSVCLYRHPAVDRIHIAGHERGFVGGEKDHDGS